MAEFFTVLGILALFVSACCLVIVAARGGWPEDEAELESWQEFQAKMREKP